MNEKVFSLDEYFASTRGIRNDPSDVEPRVVVHDVIDGKYIVGVTMEHRVGEMLMKRLDSTNFKGVTLALAKGRGTIERDKYTGRYLITPKGDAPVSARAITETTFRGGDIILAGADTVVGIDPALVPAEEMEVTVAGGSACAARWPQVAERDFEVQVRAGLTASVIPRTFTRREISWKHAMYFAQDEHIGFMRLTYNPDFPSMLEMESKQRVTSANRNAFFPAQAKNNLYFKIDFPDMGYTGFNKKPMTQTIPDASWPPYRVPVLTIDEPVEFYDVQIPDRVVMILMKQSMRLYDYTSLDVENLSFLIDDAGVLRSRWRITNQSKDVIIARWFALGNYRPLGRSEDQANRLLGPVGSGFEHHEFDFIAQAAKSSLTQFVTMNACSMGQPILSGVKKVTFRYPAE
jgi:hypothetical protein